MKILHVITSLRTGGAEKLMIELLPRLKEYGYEVDLLLFDGTDTAFRRDAESSGIKVMELGKGGSVYSPIKLFKLFSYLKKYDVVHTHNTAPQFFAAISSIFHHVLLCTTEHSTSNRRRKLKWYAPIDKWMYSRYRKVICISDKAEENLRSSIGKSRSEIITINNGVDVAKFTSAIASTELEEISPACKKMLMVAGFRWEKDQDTIIRSMPLLPDYFHLFLIGDGVRRLDCESLTRQLNVSERVHFLGVRSDVAELLKSADFVLMSSHFEGLSLSSIEGMSVGKPFIASNVDGLREVVSGAGCLFPHGDANALADTILRLSENEEEYNAVSSLCRERASQYDIASMVNGYINCYKSLFT